MNFQKIPYIDDAQTHLDIAFRRAKEKASKVKEKLRQNGSLTLPRIREVERTRFDVCAAVLTNRIKKISEVFPRIDDLSDFYQELIAATIDINKYKKSLSPLVWLLKKINSLCREYTKRINKCRSNKVIHDIRKEYYGRLSSVVEKLDSEFSYLNTVRKTMRKYPAIKDFPTVAIAGFPNVGKTTLLSKLCSSTPEIAEYAFTTKHINMGYMSYRTQKIQLLDTPGTLARDNKMNAIEKQAHLAIKHLANIVVYVFDPTESFPMKDQIKLHKMIIQEEKPMILFMSKTDVKDDKTKLMVKELKKNFPEIISSPQVLKKALSSSLF